MILIAYYSLGYLFVWIFLFSKVIERKVTNLLMMIIAYYTLGYLFFMDILVCKIHSKKRDQFINDDNCLLFPWIFLLNILVSNNTEGKTTIL